MLEEDWKIIDGYSRYMISNRGRVKSLISNTILRPMNTGNGYFQVKLFSDKKIANRKSIHRLVAQYFIPNSNDLPCVNHKDEDKSNNCVENLEWCTYKDNCNYGTRNERMAKSKINGKTSKPVLQYDTNGNFIRKHISALEASKIYGVGRSAIGACAAGQSISSCGYIWVYENDKEMLDSKVKRLRA